MQGNIGFHLFRETKPAEQTSFTEAALLGIFLEGLLARVLRTDRQTASETLHVPWRAAAGQGMHTAAPRISV